MQNPNELAYGMPPAIGPQGPMGVETMYPQGRPEPNFADGNQALPPEGQSPYGTSLASFPSGPRPMGTGAPAPQQEAPMGLPEGVIDLEAPIVTEMPEGVMDLESPLEPVRKEPGFMKKLDAINTGVHRGVTHFTYKLLSMIPSEKGRANIKAADKRLDEEQQSNIEAGMGGYAKGGELAGEMLATLPVAGPLGGVMKGASALGKALPYGAKTLGKYGAAGVGGAGVLAGMESQRYDPENPGGLLNTEAAGRALESPLSYAMPMAGAKLGAWAEQSRKLQQGRQTIPQLLPRDVLEPGMTRKMSHRFFDSLPMVTGMGKRINQLESIGDDVQGVIQRLSGGNEALMSKNLIKYSGAKLQGALKRIKKGQTELWSKPFLKKPITDGVEVRDISREALDLIEEVKTAVPLAGRSQTLIDKTLRKGTLKVDDVKNVQSIIGDVISGVKKTNSGGVGRDLTKQLTDIRHRLMNPIQKSLQGEELKDFMAAREYSSRYYKMQEATPQLKKAMYDEIAARKLIGKVISDTETVDRKAVLGIMSPKGQQAAQAAKVAKALEQSDVDGKINLSSFINRTAEKTNTPELLGDSYTAIKGLNKHLSSINEAVHGGGEGMVNKVMAAGALITYPAAAMFANHPPLKRIAGALTKNLSSSSYKYLSESLQKQLTRAGFLYGQDDVLSHKDEQGEINE